PSAPEALEKVLEKSFERDLNARYDSIASFAQALAPFASDSSKHVLARILRIREKESTTRTFSKAKIIPELKEFAKELELELGGQRESDPDAKKLEWSDEWADDIASPKRRSNPPLRPLPISLPKTSGLQIIPGVLAGRPSELAEEPPPPSSVVPPTLVTAEPQRAPAARLELPRLYPREDRSSEPEERPAYVDLEQAGRRDLEVAAPAQAPATGRKKGIVARMLLGVALFGGAAGTGVWLVKSGKLRSDGAAPQAAGTGSAAAMETPTALPTAEATPVATPASARVDAPVAPVAEPTAAPAPAPAEASPRHLCAPGTKSSAECSGGLSAWCDRDEKRVACCEVGLVPSGSGDACGCPPGGPLMPKAVAAGCSLPADAKPLSLGIIQDVIRAKQADFQACYKTLPPDPRRAFANVVVGIELSPEGRVFSARVEHSNAPDKTAEACVVGIAEALQFPPPAARGMRFLHPLTLPVGN
ncbi:MAG: AgmX/PglI C-terminal domain-containing protein, partial [Polyangiaceae bacterium]|nr:AgmX/PglI C-terminal domain-containing protein [Polyangiaceae bacterium]